MDDTRDYPIVCGMCHAKLQASEYVAHDIASHGGLASARNTHALICARAERCLCRLAEYEAQAEPQDGPYCVLCDEPAYITEPLVDTNYGPMHGDCAESHEPEQHSHYCAGCQENRACPGTTCASVGARECITCSNCRGW